VHAAYGDDVRNLDVYARCDYNLKQHRQTYSTVLAIHLRFPPSSSLASRHLHLFGCKITDGEMVEYTRRLFLLRD
jgi:hypothetical protein